MQYHQIEVTLLFSKFLRHLIDKYLSNFRCATEKGGRAIVIDREMRSARVHDEDEDMIAFDKVLDGEILCPVDSDCADPSQETGFSRGCTIHSSMAWDICSRLRDSMMDNGDDTTDIGDWGLCQFGDWQSDVAGSLSSECCLNLFLYNPGLNLLKLTWFWGLTM